MMRCKTWSGAVQRYFLVLLATLAAAGTARADTTHCSDRLQVWSVSRSITPINDGARVEFSAYIRNHTQAAIGYTLTMQYPLRDRPMNQARSVAGSRSDTVPLGRIASTDRQGGSAPSAAIIERNIRITCP